MTAVTTFIGVDLAWKSDTKHSGVVVARGSQEDAEVIACSHGLTALDDVVNYVLQHATANTVVAIDAPLIIANQRGQRPCETLIGKRFGKYHASAHTSNLTLYPNAGSVRFEAALRSQGFLHDPQPKEDRHKRGKWMFEVYPHPAQIVLFSLQSIIRYKKGKVLQKKEGLGEFRNYIRNRLLKGTPRLLSNDLLGELLARSLDTLRGNSLKQYEDLLDACFCAYLALFYWCWGGEKNEMIGDLLEGYIINPTDSP